jgi:hypothetical protein
MGVGSETVRAVSIVSLFRNTGVAPADVCLYKMDIEGGEHEVLPAMLASLPGGRLPPLYLSLHAPNYPAPDAANRIAAALLSR